MIYLSLKKSKYRWDLCMTLFYSSTRPHTPLSTLCSFVCLYMMITIFNQKLFCNKMISCFYGPFAYFASTFVHLTLTCDPKHILNRPRCDVHLEKGAKSEMIKAMQISPKWPKAGKTKYTFCMSTLLSVDFAPIQPLLYE